MRSLGGLAVALLVLAVALSLPVRAAFGAHASYFSESAFMTLTRGQLGQFAVGFLNAGDSTWTKGDSASGASLHTSAPLDNTADSVAGWASGWRAPNVYALQSADSVPPGAVAYFVYTVVAPPGAAAGPHTFYGRPFVGAAAVEDYGYYQIATVEGASVAQPSPTVAPAPTPAPTTPTSGTPTTRTVATGFTQPGEYSILVTFSKTINASTATSSNVRWDGAAFPGNLSLQSTQKSLRLDFTATALPTGGSHNLDLLDGITDTDGLKITPSITTYQVSIPFDTAAPSLSSTTAVGPSTIESTFSEPMRTVANGFASGVSVDVAGNWSILTSGGGATSFVVTSAVTGGTSADNDLFIERKVRLGLSAPLSSGVSYQVSITGSADLAGNTVSPNPATGGVSFSGGGTPTITSATLSVPSTTTPLQTFAVSYSQPMKHAGSSTATTYGACGTLVGQIDTKANYTSSPTDLGSAIQAAGTLCQISADERTVTFQFPAASTVAPVLPTGTSTTAGTYTLTVNNVTDWTATAIASASTFTVSGGSPAVSTVTRLDANNLRVSFNTKIVTSGATTSLAYWISGGSRGALCSGAAPSYAVDSSSGVTVVTITCSGGGLWGSSGSLSVYDVQQLYTNLTIAPNPNQRTF